MKILALEPYYGGSHKAFLDGWAGKSRHEWTLLTLPANKWKWRMRAAAVTFAGHAKKLAEHGKNWDMILCSDMLNLAEFLGLTANILPRLPAVVYFHENQLTYPARFESERDYQFAMTNMTTALAAGAVWFNSAFHRDEFLTALTGFLKRMPDNQPTEAIEQIRAKSKIYPQGIDAFPARTKKTAGPVRILWAGRWEHDKNPEDFFKAMKILKENNIDFRLDVLGEQFRDAPEVFAWAEDFFQEHIDRWGFLKNRSDYQSALAEADIIVSTANHEFFGISVVEAVAAGAYPLLPKRLAYPEIIANIETTAKNEFFYNGTVEDLTEKLIHLIQCAENAILWGGDPDRGRKGMQRFAWADLAPVLDNALEEVK